MSIYHVEISRAESKIFYVCKMVPLYVMKKGCVKYLKNEGRPGLASTLYIKDTNKEFIFIV